jgi:fluoroacetyl-CoA thioesterase
VAGLVILAGLAERAPAPVAEIGHRGTAYARPGGSYRCPMGLAPGLRASVFAVVGEADTAIEVGSGDVPVLATPRLLALAEAACAAAIEPQLTAGTTSVGTAASLEHRRASPVGAEIDVEAELTEVDGRRLVFSFIVRHSPPPSGQEAGRDDPSGAEDLVIGAGTLERVVVDREKFLAHALATLS